MRNKREDERATGGTPQKNTELGKRPEGSVSSLKKGEGDVRGTET